MSLSAVEKQNVIADYQRAKGDTGSTEVQVSLLTSDIKKLTEHFKAFKKDYHSKRGLMAKVAQRRSLLKYLKKSNIERYRTLIKRLKLRDIA